MILVVIASLLATVLTPSTADAAVTCRGLTVTINMNTNGGNGNGGNGNDVILGTPGADVINGGLGVDTICGGSGNDTINGGGGSDRIRGEGGHDTILAGSGADHVWGGSGNDTINGQGGRDKVYGQAGHDHIVGSHSSDWLYGGPGHDTILGQGGLDEIYGEDGDDYLSGGDNTDKLFGGAGFDELYGGKGHNDRADGGTDSDICSAEIELNCEDSEIPLTTAGALPGDMNLDTIPAAAVNGPIACAVLLAGVPIVQPGQAVNGTRSRTTPYLAPDAYIWVPKGYNVRATHASLTVVSDIEVGITLQPFISPSVYPPGQYSFNNSLSDGYSVWEQINHPDGYFKPVSLVHNPGNSFESRVSYSLRIGSYEPVAAATPPIAPVPCVVRSDNRDIFLETGSNALSILLGKSWQRVKRAGAEARAVAIPILLAVAPGAECAALAGHPESRLQNGALCLVDIAQLFFPHSRVVKVAGVIGNVADGYEVVQIVRPE